MSHRPVLLRILREARNFYVQNQRTKSRQAHLGPKWNKTQQVSPCPAEQEQNLNCVVGDRPEGDKANQVPRKLRFSNHTRGLLSLFFSLEWSC